MSWVTSYLERRIQIKDGFHFRPGKIPNVSIRRFSLWNGIKVSTTVDQQYRDPLKSKAVKSGTSVLLLGSSIHPCKYLLSPIMCPTRAHGENLELCLETLMTMVICTIYVPWSSQGQQNYSTGQSRTGGHHVPIGWSRHLGQPQGQVGKDSQPADRGTQC